MGGNTFGQIFRITTFGESHGPGVGVVIDGCPPKIELASKDFERDMARRRPGRNRLDSPRKEADRVEILSGVFEDRTTGAPVTLFIRNRDVDSKPYSVLRHLFRPGHADYTYFKKYGHFDFRGGGRSSARETAARVAAGVVAAKIFKPMGLKILAHTLELGGIKADTFHPEVIETTPCFCADPDAAERMVSALKAVQEDGDSLGGIVEIRVYGCPPGLGEPVFDKLDADIAKAVMSLGAVKGVEIGAGFEAAALKGSENNDIITPQGFETNHAGGILGGISNGDEIVVRVAVKPVPSIRKQQHTINRTGEASDLTLSGRYDTSAVPRMVPVLEAMMRIVLADHFLRSKTV